MTRRSRGPLVAALALAWAATACTGGTGPGDPATTGDRAAASSGAVSAPSSRSSSPSTGALPQAGAAGAAGAAPSPGAGTSAVPRPAPQPPREGACYRLGYDEATAPTSDAAPVPCRSRHTAQTYHVGKLDLTVDGRRLAVDAERVQERVARTCQRRLDGYVGGDDEQRALSRLHAVWFSPTLQASEAGADWFRCDVVALARSERLAPLPPPRRLRGILDRPGGLEQVGLCGTAAPGTRGFERVICARPHRWQARATIELGPGGYPGVGQVRRAGDQACRDLVRDLTDSDRFRYGWEWPTREQWRSGRHHGYCWAPD